MNDKKAKALRREARRVNAAIVNRVTGERIKLTTRQIYREAKKTSEDPSRDDHGYGFEREAPAVHGDGG